MTQAMAESRALETSEAEAPAEAMEPAKPVRRVPAKEDLVRPDGTPTPEGWHYISLKLQQPMQTKSRRGRGGREFSYITARNVQDRLDDVVGPGNWSTHYVVLHHDPTKNVVVVQCTLTIFGVSKADVGTNNNPDIPEFIEARDRNGERITDPDTGEVRMVKNPAWEDEPFKAAYSDAFKRAGVGWGVGRWLYND